MESTKSNYFKKRAPFFFLLFILLFFGLIALVMLLWNAILPDVLGVKTINYWQAMGIFVLSKLLFGGFGRGYKKNSYGKKPYGKNFMHMSAAEKEDFKNEWKKRCGS